MYRACCTKATRAALHFQWVAPALLAAIGSFALAVGVLVYMTDRDPAHVMLFPKIAVLHTKPIFGVLGPWLPSFVHPLAFSLFTAAALQRSALPAYGACAAWWVVNVTFEVAQHAAISGRLAAALQLAFGPTWPTRVLSNYFLRGTFDAGDIVAATAGALAAAGLLCFMHRLRTGHEY